MLEVIMNTASTVDVSNFCGEAKAILGFVGWLLTFFKIAIPLIIIAFGMFDLGKAVVASKDDEIKTQTKKLIIRAVAGVVIFFIPTIVMFLFEAISTFGEMESEASFEVCRKCVLEPWDPLCK